MIFGLFSIYIRISKIRHVIGKIQSGLRKIDMRKSEISGIKLFRSNSTLTRARAIVSNLIEF